MTVASSVQKCMNGGVDTVVLLPLRVAAAEALRIFDDELGVMQQQRGMNKEGMKDDI